MNCFCSSEHLGFSCYMMLVVPMNRSQGAGKRKRTDASPGTQSSLGPNEHAILDIVKGKGDMGIWIKDMRDKVNLPPTVFNKSIDSLKKNKMVKEVKNIKNKGRVHLVAAEFEPSKELTGGDWYADGNLDTEFITILKEVCFKQIDVMRVATIDQVANEIRKSNYFNIECSTQKIKEILNTLVLDNKVMTVTSNGIGEFAAIPAGTLCYKSRPKGSKQREAALTLIPCGVCPHTTICTPDGIISPKTCVYYTK
ncbi:RNA polymerase Rpc34 [Dillenia turbinata]|uniref:RNA polymerase Rpc34 n=1 Tax=Dillenia turbinata TaxID=194707 RepID=A0AAN8YZY8_9MAGN